MKLDRGGGRDVNTGVRVFYLRLKTDSNQVDWVFNNQDDGAGLWLRLWPAGAEQGCLHRWCCGTITITITITIIKNTIPITTINVTIITIIIWKTVQVRERYPGSKCELQNDRLYVDGRMFVWNKKAEKVLPSLSSPSLSSSSSSSSHPGWGARASYDSAIRRHCHLAPSPTQVWKRKNMKKLYFFLLSWA